MNNSTNYQGNFSTTNSVTSTRVPKHLAIFVITFLTICILVGSFGNARVCIVLRRRQDLRKVPHYLLANLALTGLLSTLIHMPLLIVMTTISYFQIQDVPEEVELFCRVGGTSRLACVVLNALTLSLMALDRQECVLRPFSRRLTRRNVKKFIPGIWIAALITNILYLILIRNETSVCVKFYPYSNTNEFSNLAVIAAVGQLDNVAFFIIIFTLFRILKRFRSSPMNLSVASNSTNQRQEKELTYLTYKIGGIFLLFRVPIKICIAMVAAKVGVFQEAAANAAMLVCYVALDITYVANPFLHHKILKVRRPNRARLSTAVEPMELANRANRRNQNAGVEP